MRKTAIGAIASLVILIIISLFVVRGKHIGANERGVKVSVSGLQQEALQPGLTFYCPALTSVFVADIGQQRFVMNNDSSANEKHATGREKDASVIKSSDNQDMTVSVEVLWHRDEKKVVHQQEIMPVDNDEAFAEKVLRQPIFTETKNHLTAMTAIAAYSGKEHVEAQAAIEKTLKELPEFAQKGVIIDRFLLEVKLDDAYTRPIKERQVAIQEQSAYVEKTKASEAKALQAKADAQADFNTQVVAAERDKQVAVTKAQQLSESAILAAEGEKQKVILAGEGAKEAAENEAAAILAKGKAEAEAAKLRYSAYDSVGGRTYASVQIAEQMAAAYSGVKGFIPEGMKINVLSESFQKGVGLIIDQPK